MFEELLHTMLELARESHGASGEIMEWPKSWLKPAQE